MNSSLFAVNIMQPLAGGMNGFTTKVVNVIGASIEDALKKVGAAYPGIEVKSVAKMQTIDIP